jgi:pectate lyase
MRRKKLKKKFYNILQRNPIVKFGLEYPKLPKNNYQDGCIDIGNCDFITISNLIFLDSKIKLTKHN